MLDAIIDKLTQSIEEKATGRVLDTEVRLATRADVDCLDPVGIAWNWREPADVLGYEGRSTAGANLSWREVMPAKTTTLIREPEGVDLSVAEGHLDRPTLLETAECLAAYRRQHGQSAELEGALNTLRRASRRMDAGSAASAAAD